MLVSLILLVIAGFVIGGLARFAVPGPDPMPWWTTILLGLAGSILGGLVAEIFFGTYGSFLFALAGAIALLIGYRLIVEKRPLTGPGARRRG